MFLLQIITGISLFISLASVPLPSYALPLFGWHTPWAPRLRIFILWVTTFLPFPTAKLERPLSSSQNSFCMKVNRTWRKMLKALHIDNTWRNAVLLPGNHSPLAVQPTGISLVSSPAHFFSLHFNSLSYWNAGKNILLHNNFLPSQEGKESLHNKWWACSNVPGLLPCHQEEHGSWLIGPPCTEEWQIEDNAWRNYHL